MALKHVTGRPQREIVKPGIELRNVCYFSISKSGQHILLFFSFFSVSVSQKYTVKQQSSGLFSERNSWTRFLKEPCLGHRRLNVSAFCFSRNKRQVSHLVCTTCLTSSSAAVIKSLSSAFAAQHFCCSVAEFLLPNSWDSSVGSQSRSENKELCCFWGEQSNGTPYSGYSAENPPSRLKLRWKLSPSSVFLHPPILFNIQDFVYSCKCKQVEKR